MTHEKLSEMHADLERVRELVDTAPQRFESTPHGHLAEADYDVLMRAGAVIHRLMLWQKYPQQSPESYLPQDYPVGITSDTERP